MGAGKGEASPPLAAASANVRSGSLDWTASTEAGHGAWLDIGKDREPAADARPRLGAHWGHMTGV